MAGSVSTVFFRNLSPAALMIKTWDYSNHVPHTPPPDNETCYYVFYLNCCIDAASEQWHEEYRDQQNFFIKIVPFCLLINTFFILL